MLLHAQEVIYRLDLAARTFRVKLRPLIAFVINLKVFEEGKAHLRVIEFQNQGLPNAHCIFLMTPESKASLVDPSFIDTIISAKIPNVSNSLLRQVVRKYNLHILCESFRPSAVCMDDDACTKRFPKEFVDETGHDIIQKYVK